VRAYGRRLLHDGHDPARDRARGRRVLLRRLLPLHRADRHRRSARRRAARSLHALGPRFHALAEIRLNAWSGYAAANGWSAAGVEVRREMKAAGYDPSLGDMWAVNEVGQPSGTPMGIDVMNGTGTSRQDFRDFVHGLYTGDGDVPSSGVVFAADPLQVTADPSAYGRTLLDWYRDAAFWQDMSSSVRFWAQETYADARSWGVDGATLDQRTAYLEDYFLHGVRQAANGGSFDTRVARRFLAQAYMPLGNASYRWPAPDTSTGIGFGSTDVDPSTMQSFVSSQLYALRSSSPTRFGFAVVPKSAAATDALGVEDRLAASIQGSESGASGACGTDGTWCSGSVPGASFNDAWKAFANTREGSSVKVVLEPSTTVVFATVTARGSTQVDDWPVVGLAPRGYRLVPGALAHDIETTATYTGPVRVCLARPRGRSTLRVFRSRAHGWVALKPAPAVNGRTVCGTATAVGTFAAFARLKRA
jgi:hypothetical protein